MGVINTDPCLSSPLTCQPAGIENNVVAIHPLGQNRGTKRGIATYRKKEERRRQALAPRLEVFD